MKNTVFNTLALLSLASAQFDGPDETSVTYETVTVIVTSNIDFSTKPTPDAALGGTPVTPNLLAVPEMSIQSVSDAKPTLVGLETPFHLGNSTANTTTSAFNNSTTVAPSNTTTVSPFINSTTTAAPNTTTTHLSTSTPSITSGTTKLPASSSQTTGPTKSASDMGDELVVGAVAGILAVAAALL